MPFIVIIIGAIIAIAAFNETHGDLAKALEQDIPGFFKWGIAIALILGLGYIPGLRVPSRYLIGLIALVIVLTQWEKIRAGLLQFAGGGQAEGAGNPDPTAAYVQSGGQAGTPTGAQIAGESGAASTQAGTTSSALASSGALAAPLTAAQKLAANPFSPSAYTGLIGGF